MAETGLICSECGIRINPEAFATVVSDLAWEGDKPFHWSCLQEYYERERIANGEDY